MDTFELKYSNFEAITFLETHIDKYVVNTMMTAGAIPENNIPKNKWESIQKSIDWADYNTKTFMRHFIKNLFSKNIDYLSLFTEYKELLWVLFPTLPKSFSKTLQNNKYHISSVMLHSLIAMSYCNDNNWLLRIACLFHDIGKLETQTVDENSECHFPHHAHMGAEMFKTLFFDSIFTDDERLILYTLFMHHDDYIPTTEEELCHTYRMIEKTLLDSAASFNISFNNVFYADYILTTIDLWTSLKKCDILGHDLIHSEKFLNKIYQFENVYAAFEHYIFNRALIDSIDITTENLIKYANLYPCPALSKLLFELAKMCYKEYQKTKKVFSREELIDIIKESQMERAIIYSIEHNQKYGEIVNVNKHDITIKVKDKTFTCPVSRVVSPLGKQLRPGLRIFLKEKWNKIAISESEISPCNPAIFLQSS